MAANNEKSSKIIDDNNNNQVVSHDDKNHPNHHHHHQHVHWDNPIEFLMTCVGLFNFFVVVLFLNQIYYI